MKDALDARMRINEDLRRDKAALEKENQHLEESSNFIINTIKTRSFSTDAAVIAEIMRSVTKITK